MKLYEFTGFKKYACVIAAESKEAAKAKAESLGTGYQADEIGYTELDLDVADVRDIPEGIEPEELAHYIVEDDG
jgi:hypothetical protein